jgi:hypothetical protein
VLLRVAAVPNSVVYGRLSISSAPPPFSPRLRFSTVVRTIAPDASVISAPRTPHTGRGEEPRLLRGQRAVLGDEVQPLGRHAGCPIALHRRPAGSPAPVPMSAGWSPSRSTTPYTRRYQKSMIEHLPESVSREGSPTPCCPGAAGVHCGLRLGLAGSCENRHRSGGSVVGQHFTGQWKNSPQPSAGSD